MARLAAVIVVTTAGAHGRCGIASSAACLVTGTSTTLLACLNRASATHTLLDGNRHVAINVALASFGKIARHFARMTALSMEGLFQLPVGDEGDNGVPVLRGALAALQGRIVLEKDVRSHAVMFV
jgi:flavin reductase (NADH)